MKADAAHLMPLRRPLGQQGIESAGDQIRTAIHGLRDAGIFGGILATAGATNLLLVTFLIPVTAIVLGAGVLGDPRRRR